jgi:catechol 2,3-dioxygenase-like lactoylglutathione lyase family enzyme
MSSTLTSSERAAQIPGHDVVETKLEVVVLPVSDVDRAKRFYESLGWRLDGDFSNGPGWRVVQMTPPGSQCSIHFGKGLTMGTPGPLPALYLVVSDIEAARAELVARGVDVSEVFHYATIGGPRLPGLDPQGRSYSSHASFKDPDGNGWVLQQIKERLPGRGLGLDVATLTGLLREAEQRHGDYTAAAPKHHWSTWYAAYVLGRARGDAPEQAIEHAASQTESAQQ